MKRPDLSIIIPALNEGPNLALLLPQLLDVLRGLGIDWEILVVTRGADDETKHAAGLAGARIIEQTKPGYGGALSAAFSNALGEYGVTMDADLSHKPVFVRDLWRERESADVIVASRYVPGGSAKMPLSRYALSRTLNAFYRFGLALTIRDLSSGFRLYRLDAIRNTRAEAADFDVLPELLVRAHMQGLLVKEIPFAYAPRVHGTSHARVVSFGIAYLRTFGSLWRLRRTNGTTVYDS